MIKLSGCGGIVFGFLVIVLCVVYIVTAQAVETAVSGLPIVGDWASSIQGQVLFPNAQYVFPLFGAFAMFWGVSLLRKHSWSRVVGAVLNGLLGVYAVTIMLIVAPLEQIEKYRWWFVLIGVLVALFFFYMSYYMLSKKVQWDFAERYYRLNDVDLPSHSIESQSIPLQRKSTASQLDTTDLAKPELARLLPIATQERPFSIKKPLIVIGRQESDLNLDSNDTSISRQHAKILLENGQFFLEDISRNGTEVDGQLVKQSRTPLADGVHIRFGRHVEFKFEQVYQQQSDDSKTAVVATHSILARLDPLWTEGASFDIVKDKVVIGRDPNACDLALSVDGDITISATHAMITVNDEGKFILEDLNSSNGTFVNSSQIDKPVELIEGQEIQFGKQNTRFKFHKMN